MAPRKAADNPEEETGGADAQQVHQATLVDLEELARQLKLPEAQVKKMLHNGQIRGVKVDGQWRFNPKLVMQTLGRRAKGR